MASLSRKKVASRLASKRKSSSAATEFFKGNRSRRERRGKREGVRMGAEKRPGRRRSACINSGGDNQKVAVSHSC